MFPTDAWHVGSCTKAMTATVLARLEGRGLVDTGGTLADHLPDIADGMHPVFAAMPLRRVMTHMAGIRANPHWSVFRRLRQARVGAVEQRLLLSRHALAETPSGAPRYSNLGYIVLGAVIEQAANAPWETVMRTELFEPLGMDGAGFGAPESIRGHLRERGCWVAQSTGPRGDNPLAYGPAGRVHLSLADWGRFLALHLGGGPSLYLPDSALAALHRADSNGYASGWGTGTIPGDGRPLLRHTGTNTLWFADARLVPEAGMGVAVVCNAFSEVLRDAVLAFTDGLLRDTLAASKT